MSLPPSHCSCGNAISPAEAAAYGDRCEDCYAAGQGRGRNDALPSLTGKRMRAGKGWATTEGVVILYQRPSSK